MKEGLQAGASAVVEDVVTESMFPAFGGKLVHSVYGTAAMVYHMEWAARRVILPYLDGDEDGVGLGVQVRHMHPAHVGDRLLARAVCTEVTDNGRVVCYVSVWNNQVLLGEGQVEQRILQNRVLHERFHDLWAGYES
ncbi:thioesterase [Alicyclobacillaceae bacterium I2511]|nr:thioesterase [Alicyclobacillaceae bacterium I2511]